MLGHFLRHLELLFFFFVFRHSSWFFDCETKWMWFAEMTLGLNKHFFLPFQQHFCVSHDFCRGKIKGVTILWALWITKSPNRGFMTGVGGVGFGEFQEKKHNHVPVFYLVEHFRESQSPGTITHQWRPTTDRGQINMRSLSATVTWCLENYEKMGLLGRSVARWSIWIFWMKWWLICNKRLYLECVGSPYHSSSLFLGIWLHCADGSNCPVPNWSFPSPFFSHLPNALAVNAPFQSSP